MSSQKSEFPLSWLNPFQITEAKAQGASFELTLDPPLTDQGSAYGYGINTIVNSWNSSYVYLKAEGDSRFGMSRNPASLMVYVNVPADGWYVLNFECIGRARDVTLKDYDGGRYTTVETWSQNAANSITSYPTVIELSAGNHYFYFSTVGSYLSVYEFNCYRA